MKKILISVVFGLLIIPTTQVFATSGACSDHNGVNCSYGATTLGKVMCNDGWINSSVYFSDMDECKITCTYPTNYPTCSLAEIEREKQGALGGARVTSFRTGMAGSPSGNSLTSNVESEYLAKTLACQSQLNSYQYQMRQYNSCTNTQDNISNQQEIQLQDYIQVKYDALCVTLNGSGSIWDKIYPFDMTNNNPCIPTFKERDIQCQQSDPDSYYSTVRSSCSCSENFVLNEIGQCIKKEIIPTVILTDDQTCKKFLGPYGIAVKAKVVNVAFSCVCESGYQFAGDPPSSCVLIPVKTLEISKPKTITSNPVNNSQKSVIATTSNSSTDVWYDNWYKTAHATTSNNPETKQLKWYQKLWKFFWRF